MEENDRDRVACKALAFAVLEDALYSLKAARKRRDKKQVRELMEWFSSNDHTWIFSFVPLCEWLGLDVGLMRKKLEGLCQ